MLSEREHFLSASKVFFEKLVGRSAFLDHGVMKLEWQSFELKTFLWRAENPLAIHSFTMSVK